jgi:hypothetical protein
VNSVVVVAADAHAAGPPATNAKALNNTGIHRPRDTRLEVTLHLRAKKVGWIMGVKTPISTCFLVPRRRAPENERTAT